MKNPTLFFLLPLLLAGLIACNKPIDPIFTGPFLTNEVETGPYEGSPRILRSFTYNQAGQLSTQSQQPTPNGGIPGYEKIFTYDRLGGKLTSVEQWGSGSGNKLLIAKTTYIYNSDQTLQLTIDSVYQVNGLIENKRVSFGYEGGRLTSQLMYSHEYAGGGFLYSAPITTYMIKRAIGYNGQNQVTAEIDSVWGLTSVEYFDYNPIKSITPKFRGVYKNSYTYNDQGYVESEIIYFPGFYSEGVLTTYTYSYNAKGLPTQITKTEHPVNNDPTITLISRTYSD